MKFTNINEILDHSDVTNLIDLALREDAVSNDLTTKACGVTESKRVRATILAKKKTIACGYSLVEKILVQSGHSKSIQLSRLADEGSNLKAGTPWILLEGPKFDLLSLERTFLNFLIRCCGIAEYTNQIVESLKSTTTKLLHTRKTAPGLRRPDIYACLVGGAHPHRSSLEDYLLFKENHIASLGNYQALVDAVSNHRKSFGDNAKFIEIEVRDFTELKYALMAKPNRIMLDNFKISDIEKAVQLFGSQVELEASGGITHENAFDYAKTGVDYISLGSITHSAPAADLSMLFDEAIK